MLLNMYNKDETEHQIARAEKPKMETATSRQFKVGRPKHVDLPAPKYGSRYDPLEIWDMFHKLKRKETNVAGI